MTMSKTHLGIAGVVLVGGLGISGIAYAGGSGSVHCTDHCYTGHPPQPPKDKIPCPSGPTGASGPTGVVTSGPTGPTGVNGTSGITGPSGPGAVTTTTQPAVSLGTVTTQSNSTVVGVPAVSSSVTPTTLPGFVTVPPSHKVYTAKVNAIPPVVNVVQEKKALQCTSSSCVGSG